MARDARAGDGLGVSPIDPKEGAHGTPECGAVAPLDPRCTLERPSRSLEGSSQARLREALGASSSSSKSASVLGLADGTSIQRNTIFAKTQL